MRPNQVVLTIVAAILPFPAVAQTATEAFECKLPYRATMESLGSLKILKQSSTAEDAAFGATNTVEFAPGTSVFGQKPSKLSLWMIQPRSKAMDRRVTVTLTAIFPRADKIDRALVSAVPWSETCAPSLTMCIKLAGELEGQLNLLRDEAAVIKIICRFKFREDQLGK